MGDGRIDRVLNRQLHFVTGKGGVGKSVVSCAMARAFVDRGQRTLLCQVQTREAHARRLDIEAADTDVAERSPGLWTVNIDAEEARREYGRMILKFDSLYRAVFENRVARTFLRFVPSLAELNILGKIWFHAEERDANGKLRFDRIVVDCPSTGHGLALLRVARIVHDVTGGIGPMAEKTQQMRSTLEDESRTAMHVVTLPDELPVNESIELLDAARREASAPVGAVIVNRLTPRLLLPWRAQMAQAQTVSSTWDDVTRQAWACSERRLAREIAERSETERLRAALDDSVPLLTLDERIDDGIGAEDVAALAAQLLAVPDYSSTSTDDDGTPSAQPSVGAS